MPTFAQHLFISYAHIDNQPLTPEQQGWISRFHASLQAILSTRLGGEARIWRDDKLQGNDVFADEIVEQFAETAVIVSIVSPRYIRSQWCTREIREFCDAATQNGGLVFDNKARVFKVKKTPVETEEPLPEVVQNLLGYDFFTMEDGT
ncbi:TIR domain-containing protein [Hoeflea sp.]|uniref:TIR domain-containing protein n=1 Tax=Hoeflea sp. TaxID=1940281 RepID=UPI003B021EA8